MVGRQKNTAKVKLVSGQVQAGFATWAEDGFERELSLDEYLIEHETATFMVRVSGDSMIEAGILEGDILVVDRSLEAKSGQIVIAVVDGDLTVKRYLKLASGEVELRPENKKFSAIVVPSGAEVVIWGVVTGVVRKL